MSFPFYTGKGIQSPETASLLPSPRYSDLMKPERYLPDPGLIDATNVALLLGKPLLLTGEAGTGKTQFGYNLAWELKLGELLKFETKSNSVARDLFYTYDALKRFQDVQSGLRPDSILPYITYQALGIAILQTRPSVENKELVGTDFQMAEKPARSVILIDEIDKAPRDFPNDILNEIENMYFRIPEMGNRKIEADRDLSPIVIITSNSEKDLPDAFLRRCIYYNISFPDKERLRAIVSMRLGSYVSGASAFIDDALDFFFALREVPGGLHKPPSTAEMLDWVITLKKLEPERENPLARRTLIWRTLSTLIKTTADHDKVRDVIQKWLIREK